MSKTGDAVIHMMNGASEQEAIAAVQRKTHTVYVVAWQYEGGAGFNWYFTAQSADTAYAEEEANTAKPNLAAEGWSAYRFDFPTDTDPHADGEKITREIDADLDELCVAAPRKKENILPQYGKTLSELPKMVRIEIDVQGPVHEIAKSLGEVAQKAAEAEGLTIAQVVDLIVSDTLGNGWVDDELQHNMAASLCQLFPNQAKAVNLPEED